MADHLNTELFILDLPPWAIHGAGYEDQGEVGTEVVEGRALGELAQVGGADSTIIFIARRRDSECHQNTNIGMWRSGGGPHHGS